MNYKVIFKLQQQLEDKNEEKKNINHVICPFLKNLPIISYLKYKYFNLLNTFI